MIRTLQSKPMDNEKKKRPSYLEYSSLHGLKYTTKKYHRCQRFFWCIVIILGVALSLLLSLAIWSRYYSLPTRISIATQFAPTESVNFPAITICSANRMKRYNVERFLKSITELPNNLTIDKIRDALPQMHAYIYYSIFHRYRDLKMLQSVLTLNRHETRRLMEYLPQSCEDFLVKCKWEGEFVDCRQFFESTVSFIGSCCSFNYLRQEFEGKSVVNTEYFGPHMGLTVLYDTMAWDAEILDSSGSSLVIVHESIEFPTINHGYIWASPGHETFIEIKPMHIFLSDEAASLPIEARECFLPDEKQLKYFNSYHEGNCQMNCVINLIKEKCECIRYFPTERITGKACELVDIPCGRVVVGNHLLNHNYYEEICQCFSLCNNTIYTANTHSTTINAVHSSIDPIYDNVNFSDSVGVIHIYLSKQQVIFQRKDALATWMNALSSLGGVFSLCLGFSFVSICEIICMLSKYIHAKRQEAIQIFSNLFKRFQNHKKIPKMNTNKSKLNQLTVYEAYWTDFKPKKKGH